MRPFGSQKELERRRHRAIEMVLEGFNLTQVALEVGAKRRSVRRWKAAYREEGMKGLEAKPVACGPMKWRGKRKLKRGRR